MSHLIHLTSSIFRQTPGTNPSSAILTTALITFAVITLSRFTFKGGTIKVIKSPVATLLPGLTQAEKDALPYPPDSYPGARDVESPYGTLRVYEWGPEEGRKVLIIHGVTTSSLAVGAVANGLVELGCRVMIFDLWGRGYSDSPADLPHDERLYSTQVLLAISSSPLPWTGSHGFSLIGYSLGGCIAASFTSYFPNLVNALALIAPVGLIREPHLTKERRLLSLLRILPIGIVEAIVKWKLQRPLFPPKDQEQREIAALTGAEEGADGKKSKNIPASLRYPDVKVLDAIQWQIRVHAGFTTSILSTGFHMPVTGQQETWRRLGRLRRDRFLVIVGSHDPIVVAEELKEDVTEVLGVEKVEWRVIDGMHDIPGTAPGEIVDAIRTFWGIGKA